MRRILILLFIFVSVAGFGSIGAGFTPDKSAGCPPLVVNFTNNSVGDVTSWLWDFGNGNTSTLQNPSATFLTSGRYTVKLTVSNGQQSDSTFQTITIFKLPIVDFSVSPANACLTDTISFFGKVIPGDAGIANYAWGFGNGVASSEQNARYRYPETGTFNITLVVQDSNSCSANKTEDSVITIDPLPVAAFTASPTTSCKTSQLVTFTNQSTGVGLSYSWSFGDSTSSTLQNPTHVYAQEIATAVLLVTDTNGCQSKASKKISVTDITPDFTASKTLICTGQKVQFANTSNFEGTTWLWNFGDGTTSNAYSPIKVYTVAGMYTVSFSISNGDCGDSITKVNYITVVNGFSNGTPGFTADSTITCGKPLNVQFTDTTPVPPGSTYLWTFGNGDSSSQQNPSEYYSSPGNYTVSLTITDTSGCVISIAMPAFIQTAKPIANFIADTLACIGTSIQFYNKSTNSSSVEWYFGDGDSSSNANPPHTYYQYGNYTVTLVAYNSAGCDTTVTKVDYIHIDSTKVNFTVNTTFSPCPPLVTIFTSTSSAGATKYLWDFGDGYTDTAADPTHIFFYPGVYSVKLIGYSPGGCTDTVLYNNLITVQGPTGNFTINPKTGCAPLQVNFSASPSSDTKSIWCDLGDGNVIYDSLNFTHTYTAVRVYHPQFVLTDHVGCTVSYPSDSIITYSLPELHFSDTTVCANSIINMSLSDSSYYYSWSPSTYLDCDSCGTVNIIPSDTITYQILAINQYGCQTSGVLNINAVPLPVLNNSVKVTLCPEDSVPLYVGMAEKILWVPNTYLDDSSSLRPICRPLTSINYMVYAYNAIGCSVTTQVPVTVSNKVEVEVADSLNACEGSDLQFQTKLLYSSDLGVNYQWSAAQYFNNPNIADPVATIGDQDMTFNLVVTSGHCLPDSHTIQVMVQPLPDIEASGNITTTPGAEVQLFAASHQDLSYQWTAKDSLTCPDCRRTNIYPTTSQIVYVQGTNPQGCTVRDSVEIQVVGCDPNTIYMPNTFTPNGDGLNDKFYVRSHSLALLKSFRIYDEWGQLVYQSNNIEEGWDGTVSGRPAPIGVYVYMVEGVCENGSEVMKSGNVTAIR